jgi:hypothetical protein
MLEWMWVTLHVTSTSSSSRVTTSEPRSPRTVHVWVHGLWVGPVVVKDRGLGRRLGGRGILGRIEGGRLSRRRGKCVRSTSLSNAVVGSSSNIIIVIVVVVVIVVVNVVVVVVTVVVVTVIVVVVVVIVCNRSSGCTYG